MSTELVLRWSTILFHTKAGVKPVGGLELVHLGNLGVTFSLRGKGFYENLNGEEGWKDFRAAGVDTLLCAISSAHYRLIRQMVVGAAHIQRCGWITLNGNRFILLLIRDPSATTSHPFEDLIHGNQVPNS